MKVARTVWTYTKTERLVRDGKPEVESTTVGGKAVTVVNNAVEVKYEEDTEVIPAVTVNFKNEVKVQSITDKNGKVYASEAQLAEAKAWLGYTGDLTAFTSTVTLTGTTKTFADVIARLGDSFQVTVVNEAGETLTLTINLKLDVPAPVSATVTELNGEVLEPLAGVYAVTILKANVEAKFPGITEATNFLLTIGEKNWTLKFNAKKQIWASEDIQGVTKDDIKVGVVTVIK